jgi:hypothetical protein
MDEPFRKLFDELQGLATEDERPHVDEGARPTEAIPEAKPAARPAMPLPRNVRGRRY